MAAQMKNSSWFTVGIAKGNQFAEIQHTALLERRRKRDGADRHCCRVPSLLEVIALEFRHRRSCLATQVIGVAEQLRASSVITLVTRSEGKNGTACCRSCVNLALWIDPIAEPARPPHPVDAERFNCRGHRLAAAAVMAMQHR